MKRLAKKILKNVEEENGVIPTNINTNIPDYKEIEDPKQAKETMKNYLENLIADTEEVIESTDDSKTKKVLDQAKNILNDPKFIEQKGVRSLVDEDARVGHKTKTSSFFGYKTEFAMLTEERIITAVTVGNGAYVDGNDFNKLYSQKKENK